MIDTNDFRRRLLAVDFTPAQADRMADLLKETSLGMASSYVTHEILRYELRLQDQRMLLKLTAIMTAELGVVVGLLALILR